MSASSETAGNTVKVTSPGTVISRSCRVVIPAGAVLPDKLGRGAIRIGASDIEIEFAKGSVLRGSPASTDPDEYKGVGIRLNGHRNVTIRGARVHGFWCGIQATEAHGLTLEGADASDNRRARLRSTPAAEDADDWMYPHHNDQGQWLENYAAAIWIERSDSVTVRACRVQRGQNALCLVRVNDSRVYDNDFSFNSGWGVAMWRSCRNVLSRNALDFCIRGHSHEVYNRGQDSAGILLFEQNCRNVIAENSVTHGGDGFFGFAGAEALGEVGRHSRSWYRRRGNNDNLLVRNDFSYAAAHGIEMTFSFGNRFLRNRMVANAICGIWGGLSQDTLIAGNVFQRNGQMGYGLESGGVNIDHGRGNRIVHNAFRKNTCGVHLWGGEVGKFAAKSWAKVNGTESTENLIASNVFDGEAVAFRFRGPGDVTIGANELRDVGRKLLREPDSKVIRRARPAPPPLEMPKYPVYGQTRPVGARPRLRGRKNIIMTEWGPWDHASPLVRRVPSGAGYAVYALHGMRGKPRVTVRGRHLRGAVAPLTTQGDVAYYAVRPPRPGAYPYVLNVAAGAFRRQIRHTLAASTWQAKHFKWTDDVDPREDLAGWRKLASGSKAVSIEVGQPVFGYGCLGPKDRPLRAKLRAGGIDGRRTGMIATTRLPLSKGTWQFTTFARHGIRVTVDGNVFIEKWDWLGATRNTGTLDLPAAREVEILVEHFELWGFASMELQLSRVE